jgi:hypothetical protein
MRKGMGGGGPCTTAMAGTLEIVALQEHEAGLKFALLTAERTDSTDLVRHISLTVSRSDLA